MKIVSILYRVCFILPSISCHPFQIPLDIKEPQPITPMSPMTQTPGTLGTPKTKVAKEVPYSIQSYLRTQIHYMQASYCLGVEYWNCSVCYDPKDDKDTKDNKDTNGDHGDNNGDQGNGIEFVDTLGDFKNGEFG